MRQNKLHFSQASNTPLATNKIIKELGFSGSTETARQILNGTETIEEFVEYEALWDLLQSFQRKAAKFKVKFDSDDMIKGYRSRSEKQLHHPQVAILDIFMRYSDHSSFIIMKNMRRL